MLVNEWSLLVDVALEADGIAIRLRIHLPDRGSPVHVMTVVALHQALVHPMMVGL
jgi:hypothetical protein